MSHEDRVPTDSTAAVERCLDQLRLGRPVIVVDYSGTAVGFVRDELRADGRGGYWGRALNGTTELLRFHLTR